MRVVQPVALAPHERWSLDFRPDTLGNGPRTRVFGPRTRVFGPRIRVFGPRIRVFGPRIRVLTVVDHLSRVSRAIEVDTGLSGRRVIEVLERAAACYGLPKTICVDNGPEFSGRALDQWAHRQGVKLQFSRPGKPTDNAMIETFSAKVRAECLDQHWFTSLQEAQVQVEAWRQNYNEQRPHSSLNNHTPAEFMACWQHRQQPEKAKS